MTDNYVSIDIETTGLNFKMDNIIEIGAIRVKGGVEEAKFQTFVNPGKILSPEIKKLTHITQEEADSGIEIKKAIQYVIDFVGEFPIMAHNVMFDYTFLKRAAINHQFTFEKDGIDTLRIARHYLPELESKKLSSICQYYEIPHNAHRALADAKATSDLYLKMAKEFYEEEYFKPQKLICKIKKEMHITNHQKERLYALVDKHKLIIDYDVDKLTRNQASRYTDRILAEYGR